MTSPGEPWWTVPMVGWSDARPASQERGRTTRHELLLAAARLFDVRGYHGASLTDILVESGRTKGALYFHYPSKQALAEALTAETVESWEIIRARIADRGLDPLQALLVETDTYVGRWSHDPIVRGASAAMSSAALFAPRNRQWHDDWEKGTATHLHHARDLGLLREGVDPDRASRLVVAAAAGHHVFAETMPGPPDLFTRMTDTWLGFLPVVAASPWLAAFSTSGWSARPAPDTQAYALVRTP